MPWHVGTSDECPASKPYAVIKDADGSVAGCHETRKEAEAQMAALYANDKADKAGMPQTQAEMRAHLTAPKPKGHGMASADMSMAEMQAKHATMHEGSAGHMHSMKATYLKAERVGTAKWRVLAIPFGGPFKGGKDLDGEFFSPRTDIKADWFDRRPALWHHAMDPELKDETLGVEDDLTLEKDGWWGTVWLDRANRYWEQVNALLEAGKVYGSSGALGHLVRKDHKTGEILVWPHIEQTLTPTPSNFYSRVVPMKALDHFDDAGLDLAPALRGLITDLDSHTADLRPDLATAADAATLGRLSGELSALLERTNHIR